VTRRFASGIADRGLSVPAWFSRGCGS
jgi:hypothetical protein